jgi:hypothetical protein
MTFSPGASVIADATIVTLAYGDERGSVDVALAPVPVWRVSGVVQGPAEALANLTLRLLADGLTNAGQAGEVATALVGGNGRFTFANVPAGTYTIEAPRTIDELTTTSGAMTFRNPTLPPPPGRSGWSRMTQGLDAAPSNVAFSTTNFRGPLPPYFGQVPLTVGGHDEDDVVLPLRSTGTMSGRVTVETDPARQASPTSPTTVLHLEAADGDPSLGWLRAESSPNAPANEFRVQGLLAGTYVLRVAGDWVVKSVRWNGEDHTDEPFDAGPTQDFPNVDVVVTTAGAALAGTVRDAQGAPADGTRVVIFPADPRLREHDGLSRPRTRSAVVGSTGAFRIGSIPAGTYCVIAIEIGPDTPWYDADFMARAARSATEVSLAWGEAKTLDLTSARVR